MSSSTRMASTVQRVMTPKFMFPTLIPRCISSCFPDFSIHMSYTYHQSKCLTQLIILPLQTIRSPLLRPRPRNLHTGQNQKETLARLLHAHHPSCMRSYTMSILCPKQPVFFLSIPKTIPQVRSLSLLPMCQPASTVTVSLSPNGRREFFTTET